MPKMKARFLLASPLMSTYEEEGYSTPRGTKQTVFGASTGFGPSSACLAPWRPGMPQFLTLDLALALAPAPAPRKGPALNPPTPDEKR
jgi:hypothetical protein